MKITIERASLLKSLGHVQSVVERRNTIPILNNVKLSTQGGRLDLNATDMDLDIVEGAAAEVLTEGATTAPAHTLFDIVRKLPDGAQVELDATGDGDKLVLRAGRSKFSLATLPIEDFPLMSGGELPHEFAMSAGELRGIIDRTRFAISTEETRYYLNGIYVHAAKGPQGDVLRAVATDGHRLASVDCVLPSGAAEIPGVIVPRKTVTELRKLLEDAAGDVMVSLSETKIRFRFDDSVLTSKLIDGTFPDYQRVIPANNDKALEVDTRLMEEAVDRVSAISTEKSRAIKLSMKENTLILSANSPESGTATEEIEVSYTAEAMDAGFNSRYLLDIIHQIEGETMRFSLADGASPTLAQDTSDGSALYVLMPMRV
ncbi:MAG: DNA polymerase III subunit beta [Magnetospiraceae bacterium]